MNLMKMVYNSGKTHALKDNHYSKIFISINTNDKRKQLITNK